MGLTSAITHLLEFIDLRIERAGTSSTKKIPPLLLAAAKGSLTQQGISFSLLMRLLEEFINNFYGYPKNLVSSLLTDSLSKEGREAASAKR